MNESQDDFTSALNKEFGIEPETPPETPPAADPPAAEPPAEPAPAEGEKPAEQVSPAGEAEPEKPADPPAEGEPAGEPKFATKDDVAAALREYNEETSGRVAKVHEARDEIIEKLHPEGIDKNIYDSNGEQIKTAQDIVDRGLINQQTGEAYTYDEAASWIMGAQQQMNKNVEELQSWADDIAEKNISLIESNERVMAEHGELLQAMPQLASQLAEEYVKTQLEFDKTGSYITRVGMTPETFYKLTLAPYKELGEAITAKEALEAQVAEKAQKQEQAAEQSERMGLPPQRGQSKTKANTGDPMLDALVDELNEP